MGIIEIRRSRADKRRGSRDVEGIRAGYLKIVKADTADGLWDWSEREVRGRRERSGKEGPRRIADWSRREGCI